MSLEFNSSPDNARAHQPAKPVWCCALLAVLFDGFHPLPDELLSDSHASLQKKRWRSQGQTVVLKIHDKACLVRFHIVLHLGDFNMVNHPVAGEGVGSRIDDESCKCSRLFTLTLLFR